MTIFWCTTLASHIIDDNTHLTVCILTHIHKDFEESNPDLKVSHTRYYEEIKTMNIGFAKLGERSVNCVICKTFISKKIMDSQIKMIKMIEEGREVIFSGVQ